jgi:hypothetical protein
MSFPSQALFHSILHSPISRFSVDLETHFLPGHMSGSRRAGCCHGRPAALREPHNPWLITIHGSSAITGSVRARNLCVNVRSFRTRIEAQEGSEGLFGAAPVSRDASSIKWPFRTIRRLLSQCKAEPFEHQDRVPLAIAPSSSFSAFSTACLKISASSSKEIPTTEAFFRSRMQLFRRVIRETSSRRYPLMTCLISWAVKS